MMRGTGCYSLYKLQPASGCHSLYQAATACRGEGWGRGRGVSLPLRFPQRNARRQTNIKNTTTTKVATPGDKPTYKNTIVLFAPGSPVNDQCGRSERTLEWFLKKITLVLLAPGSSVNDQCGRSERTLAWYAQYVPSAVVPVRCESRLRLLCQGPL